MFYVFHAHPYGLQAQLLVIITTVMAMPRRRRRQRGPIIYEHNKNYQKRTGKIRHKFNNCQSLV